jgi:AraC-like DNA-binding protein
MKLFVKYMVSLRCKMIVQRELENLGIKNAIIELGVVEFNDDFSAEQLDMLNTELLKSGLEIIDDQKAILIEKIKNLVIELVHYSDEVLRENNSEFISHKLDYDYTYLSNLFSAVTGITIQQFIILHKIEKAKELILYDELNLTEIADKLNYSSVAHLSNQFKKITGLTPTFFKQIGNRKRKNLEDV